MRVLDGLWLLWSFRYWSIVISHNICRRLIFSFLNFIVSRRIIVVHCITLMNGTYWLILFDDSIALISG